MDKRNVLRRWKSTKETFLDTLSGQHTHTHAHRLAVTPSHLKSQTMASNPFRGRYIHNKYMQCSDTHIYIIYKHPNDPASRLAGFCRKESRPGVNEKQSDSSAVDLCLSRSCPSLSLSAPESCSLTSLPPPSPSSKRVTPDFSRLLCPALGASLLHQKDSWGKLMRYLSG